MLRDKLLSLRSALGFPSAALEALGKDTPLVPSALLGSRMEFVNGDPEVQALWLVLVHRLKGGALAPWLPFHVEDFVVHLLFGSDRGELLRAYEVLVLGRENDRPESSEPWPQGSYVMTTNDAVLDSYPSYRPIWEDTSLRLFHELQACWSLQKLQYKLIPLILDIANGERMSAERRLSTAPFALPL